MNITFSHHALDRMKERNIQKGDVLNTLLQADKIEKEVDWQSRFVAKRIYQSLEQSKTYLMLVVYEVENDFSIHVVTVITTSKIQKYL